MRLRFTKMHGLGNDFVVLDGISQKLSLTTEKIQYLANRNFGIGCDQVLLVEAPRKPDADFRYRIFNSAGGEVENCGNGARCFALFVRQRGLTCKNVITVETLGGNLVLHVLNDDQVTVNMGIPVFEPARIPMRGHREQRHYSLTAEERLFNISALSMGNPHAVIMVDNVEHCELPNYGPLLAQHEAFPQGVNVGFLQILSRHEGNLRVYERGVGETLACGSGACAAMVAGRIHQKFDRQVKLNLLGGSLHIRWEGKGKPVMMSGPAVSVFQGQIKL